MLFARVELELAFAPSDGVVDVEDLVGAVVVLDSEGGDFSGSAS